MRLLPLIISLLCFSSITYGQQDLFINLEYDGEDRNFLLYLPSSYSDFGQAMPMVFNFHGFGSTSFQQRGYSDMNRVAEEEGFIVCYPSGIDAAWNVDWAFGSTADDVGFTSAIIDTLLSDYNINPGRIYSCGMSNGGFFSYQLACTLSDRIAAVASVTGSFSPNMMQNCSPSRKVPVMEIHGTDDAVVPYDGLAGTAEPIEEVIEFWVNHNNCDDTFELIEIEDANPNDDSTVSVNYYTQCEDGTEVLFAKVDGGGHTWPSSPIILGGTNLDYDASQEIWNFFEKHKIEEIANTADIYSLDFEIYPNPSSTLVNLDSRIDSYSLFTSAGNMLLKGQKKILDISTLNPGIYFIEMRSEGFARTKRIIKN